ncbi:transposase, partial [Staphylococcus agnetis]
MSNDTNSLAHTKWNCKYHIVFAPKYRRQIIYGKLKRDIGIILRQLCERKGVEII